MDIFPTRLAHSQVKAIVEQLLHNLFVSIANSLAPERPENITASALSNKH
jgi:hypothetical protein|tara:strand:- start:551 stop:700 length:150 start_codon:yes stop_codon:yes gene_type:complete